MMNLHRFLFLILLPVLILFMPAAGDPPPVPASAATQVDLSAAYFERLQRDPAGDALVFDLFTPELDTAFLSPDGETAVLWLALRDDSGRRLATEPGLALAFLWGDDWQVLLPGDPGWEERLATLAQDGMLPPELSPALENAPLETDAASALTGYYLPYAAGTSRWLEGSISHFQSIPELGYPSCSQEYCRYAYDFTDVWHFPLLASSPSTCLIPILGRSCWLILATFLVMCREYTTMTSAHGNSGRPMHREPRWQLWVAVTRMIMW